MFYWKFSTMSSLDHKAVANESNTSDKRFQVNPKSDTSVHGCDVAPNDKTLSIGSRMKEWLHEQLVSSRSSSLANSGNEEETSPKKKRKKNRRLNRLFNCHKLQNKKFAEKIANTICCDNETITKSSNVQSDRQKDEKCEEHFAKNEMRPEKCEQFRQKYKNCCSKKRLEQYKNRDKDSVKNNDLGNSWKKSFKSVQSIPTGMASKITISRSKYLALDCEFVGVGPRKVNALGRCSIVDYHGNIVYDSFCMPPEKITDYRTRWSGIRPKNLAKAPSFEVVQKDVKDIIKDHVIIGHAVFNDINVLGIHHPPEDIRDTSKCNLLKERSIEKGTSFGLKSMSMALLGWDIQKREHCSVEDARASLALFKLVEKSWTMENSGIKRKIQENNIETDSKRLRTYSSNSDYLSDQFWPDQEWNP